MWVNDIKLPAFFKYASTYKFFGYEHMQATTWGCNGIWEWPFETPILNWVLDKKIENHEIYTSPKILHKERLRLEQEKLQRLADQLSKLNV